MILTYLSSKTLYYKFWLPIWLKEPFYRPHYNIIIVFLKFAAQVTPRCSSILNYTRCGNWVTRIFSIIFCYNTNIMCHLGIENLQLQTHNPLKYCSWVVKMWSARAFFLSVAKKWVTWDLNKGSAAHPRREGAKVFSLGRRLPLKKKKHWIINTFLALWRFFMDFLFFVMTSFLQRVVIEFLVKRGRFWYW